MTIKFTTNPAPGNYLSGIASQKKPPFPGSVGVKNPLAPLLPTKPNMSPVSANFQPISGSPKYVPPPSMGAKALTPVAPKNSNVISKSSTQPYVSPTQPSQNLAPEKLSDDEQKALGYTYNIYTGQKINSDDTKVLVSSDKKQPAQPVPSMAQNGLYGQLIQKLIDASGDTSGIDSANKNLAKFREDYAAKIGGIESHAIPLEFQQGRSQVLSRQGASQEAALESALSTAQTQRTNTLNSLYQAAGLAQPVQVPYSNQFIDPTTGQPIGGGGNAMTGNLQNDVSSIAQSVQNGTMGYDAGVQALSMYGGRGGLALKQLLGPSFDVTQSNAQAAAKSASTLQTGTTGGQISKSAESAKAALSTLETAFSGLSKLQTGGIPATNSISNWIASKLGQGALSNYKSVLADARAQLEGVLTATGAVTPTGAEAMAMQYLPDDMTPEILKQKLAAARTLIQQKVSAFSGSTGGGGGGKNPLGI